MSDFNPGEGWREVTVDEYVERGSGHGPRLNLEDGGAGRFWVREAPVPPLPTEDGTTIRVQWRKPASEEDDYQRSIILVLIAGMWYEPHFGRYHADLSSEITGFEVLAEPRHGAVKRAEESARRLTAKAVLDRIDVLDPVGRGLNDSIRTQILREFGKSS